MIDENEWNEAPEGFIDYVLPSHWACYLINGDASGMSDKEQAEVDAFAQKEGVGYCAACSDEEWFARRNDASTLGGNVLNFRFANTTQK